MLPWHPESSRKKGDDPPTMPTNPGSLHDGEIAPKHNRQRSLKSAHISSIFRYYSTMFQMRLLHLPRSRCPLYVGLLVNPLLAVV